MTYKRLNAFLLVAIIFFSMPGSAQAFSSVGGSIAVSGSRSNTQPVASGNSPVNWHNRGYGYVFYPISDYYMQAGTPGSQNSFENTVLREQLKATKRFGQESSNWGAQLLNFGIPPGYDKAGAVFVYTNPTYMTQDAGGYLATYKNFIDEKKVMLESAQEGKWSRSESNDTYGVYYSDPNDISMYSANAIVDTFLFQMMGTTEPGTDPEKESNFFWMAPTQFKEEYGEVEAKKYGPTNRLSNKGNTTAVFEEVVKIAKSQVDVNIAKKILNYITSISSNGVMNPEEQIMKLICAAAKNGTGGAPQNPASPIDEANYLYYMSAIDVITNYDIANCEVVKGERQYDECKTAPLYSLNAKGAYSPNAITGTNTKISKEDYNKAWKAVANANARYIQILAALGCLASNGTKSGVAWAGWEATIKSFIESTALFSNTARTGLAALLGFIDGLESKGTATKAGAFLPNFYVDLLTDESVLLPGAKEIAEKLVDKNSDGGITLDIIAKANAQIILKEKEANSAQLAKYYEFIASRNSLHLGKLKYSGIAISTAWFHNSAGDPNQIYNKIVGNDSPCVTPTFTLINVGLARDGGSNNFVSDRFPQRAQPLSTKIIPVISSWLEHNKNGGYYWSKYLKVIHDGYNKISGENVFGYPAWLYPESETANQRAAFNDLIPGQWKIKPLGNYDWGLSNIYAGIDDDSGKDLLNTPWAIELVFGRPVAPNAILPPIPTITTSPPGTETTTTPTTTSPTITSTLPTPPPPPTTEVNPPPTEVTVETISTPPPVIRTPVTVQTEPEHIGEPGTRNTDITITTTETPITVTTSTTESEPFWVYNPVPIPEVYMPVTHFKWYFDEGEGQSVRLTPANPNKIGEVISHEFALRTSEKEKWEWLFRGRQPEENTTYIKAQEYRMINAILLEQSGMVEGEWYDGHGKIIPNGQVTINFKLDKIPVHPDAPQWREVGQVVSTKYSKTNLKTVTFTVTEGELLGWFADAEKNALPGRSGRGGSAPSTSDTISPSLTAKLGGIIKDDLTNEQLGGTWPNPIPASRYGKEDRNTYIYQAEMEIEFGWENVREMKPMIDKVNNKPILYTDEKTLSEESLLNPKYHFEVVDDYVGEDGRVHHKYNTSGETLKRGANPEDQMWNKIWYIDRWEYAGVVSRDTSDLDKDVTFVGPYTTPSAFFSDQPYKAAGNKIKFKVPFENEYNPTPQGGLDLQNPVTDPVKWKSFYRIMRKEVNENRVWTGAESYSEIKEGALGNEEWEAMAGVPTTEMLYYTVGGSTFVIDISVSEIWLNKLKSGADMTPDGPNEGFNAGTIESKIDLDPSQLDSDNLEKYLYLEPRRYGYWNQDTPKCPHNGHVECWGVHGFELGKLTDICANPSIQLGMTCPVTGHGDPDNCSADFPCDKPIDGKDYTTHTGPVVAATQCGARLYFVCTPCKPEVKCSHGSTGACGEPYTPEDEEGDEDEEGGICPGGSPAVPCSHGTVLCPVKCPAPLHASGCHEHYTLQAYETSWLHYTLDGHSARINGLNIWRLEFFELKGFEKIMVSDNKTNGKEERTDIKWLDAEDGLFVTWDEEIYKDDMRPTIFFNIVHGPGNAGWDRPQKIKTDEAGSYTETYDQDRGQNSKNGRIYYTLNPWAYDYDVWETPDTGGDDSQCRQYDPYHFGDCGREKACTGIYLTCYHAFNDTENQNIRWLANCQHEGEWEAGPMTNETDWTKPIRNDLKTGARILSDTAILRTPLGDVSLLYFEQKSIGDEYRIAHPNTEDKKALTESYMQYKACAEVVPDIDSHMVADDHNDAWSYYIVGSNNKNYTGEQPPPIMMEPVTFNDIWFNNPMSIMSSIGSNPSAGQKDKLTENNTHIAVTGYNGKGDQTQHSKQLDKHGEEKSINIVFEDTVFSDPPNLSEHPQYNIYEVRDYEDRKCKNSTHPGNCWALGCSGSTFINQKDLTGEMPGLSYKGSLWEFTQGRKYFHPPMVDDSRHMVEAWNYSEEKYVMTSDSYEIQIRIPNGEYETGESIAWYRPMLNYKGYEGKWPIDAGAVFDSGRWNDLSFLNEEARGLFHPSTSDVNKAYEHLPGFAQSAGYTTAAGSVNNIVIHDPVSVEYAFLFSLPNERDQRVGVDCSYEDYNLQDLTVDNPNYVAETRTINVSDNTYAEAGFFNLDWGFQFYFPNLGDFYTSWNGNVNQWSGGDDRYSASATESLTGRSYIDEMRVDDWVEKKWIVCSFNVIYEGITYKAGDPIYIYQRNEADYYDRSGDLGYLLKQVFRMYIPLNNIEQAPAIVEFNMSAINSRNPYITDNYAPSNVIRDQGTRDHAAYEDAREENYIDLVGRIGNLVMEDVSDPLYSMTFKMPANPLEWLSENIKYRTQGDRPFRIVGVQTDIRMIPIDSTALFLEDVSRWEDWDPYDGWATDVYQESYNYYLDTYGTIPNRNKNVSSFSRYSTPEATPLKFPMSAEKNQWALPQNVPHGLRTQEIKVGYEALLDISTIGEYNQAMIIKPYWYFIDLQDPSLSYQPIDIYAREGGDYKLIYKHGLFEDCDNFNQLYETYLDVELYNMDWDYESPRRNLTQSGTDPTGNGIQLIGDITGANPPSPSGPDNILGSTQLIVLYPEEAKVSFGSEYTNGVYNNPGDVLSESGYITRGGLWNFKIGLPSGAIPVLSSENTDWESGIPNDEVLRKIKEGKTRDINNRVREGRGLLICAVEIIAIGDVWNLQYEPEEFAFGASVWKRNFELEVEDEVGNPEVYPPAPEDGSITPYNPFPRKTGGGSGFGSPTDPSKEGEWVVIPDPPGKKIPIIIVDANKDATDDKETQGTH